MYYYLPNLFKKYEQSIEQTRQTFCLTETSWTTFVPSRFMSCLFELLHTCFTTVSMIRLDRKQKVDATVITREFEERLLSQLSSKIIVYPINYEAVKHIHSIKSVKVWVINSFILRIWKNEMLRRHAKEKLRCEILIMRWKSLGEKKYFEWCWRIGSYASILFETKNIWSAFFAICQELFLHRKF